MDTFSQTTMMPFTMVRNQLIIGFGMVGKATAYALDIHSYIDCPDDNPDQVDITLLENASDIFLCVPTPTNENGEQDLSAIRSWLGRMGEFNTRDDSQIIIRSTVLPSKARELITEFPNLSLIFWPEFLTEKTALHDSQFPELFIVGCDNILRQRAFVNLIKPKLQGKFRTIETTPETACMIKYAINTFFGLKVVFANQLFDAAKEQGADYDEIKRALEYHKWGSKNGWNVFHGGDRGFGGKCLPKDIKAFQVENSLDLLNKLLEINRELRGEDEQTTI